MEPLSASLRIVRVRSLKGQRSKVRVRVINLGKEDQEGAWGA
jgi:hypothetical protein